MYLSTNDQERNKLIKNYFFNQKPNPPSLNKIIYILLSLITIGVAFMLLFQSIAIMISSVGFISIILYRTIIFPYFNKKRIYNSRISDDKIYQWLIEDLKSKIKNRALEYLQLQNESISPEQLIIIPYPVFHPTQKIENDKLHRIYSNKGFFNYSFWNVQLIILSKKYLSYYFCSYNWLDEEILNEKSSEFFYEDITTVRNDIEEINFKNKWYKEPLSEAHILKLLNISGDVLYLITELPELEQAKNTIINQEKAVQAIRMIIRQVRSNDKSRYRANLNFNSEISDEKIEEEYAMN
ncbi:MAG: hypothetical protein JXR51_03690 [Bacteroidales bacterium]|nr:hypothetical protein [Bacteroidales bacterium]MBN2756256.1 hypothetical protein [Bacteroidales bacterium]